MLGVLLPCQLTATHTRDPEESHSGLSVHDSAAN
jgi:hypothetical protein